jgi:acetylornithine deacetylase/succinyl-diaminopimelate desuccinylase-like protein
LAEIAAEVVRLRLPRQPPASINIGTVRGGIGINAIAPEAKMTVDLRCENAETLDRLEARLREIRSTHQGKGFRISLDLIGERPAGAIAPLHPLVRAAGRTGAGHELGAGSTDANVPLGLGLPSLCVGPSKGGEAPTPQEFIERPPRKPRLRFLFLLLREAFSGPP